MRPDECHEHYPGAAEANCITNTYTKPDGGWIASIILRVLDLLPTSRRAALRVRLGVTDDELRRTYIIQNPR
jgi:hypothetical protein